MRTLLFASIALAPLLAGCSKELPRRPNVLLIVVDTLRQDHLEPYGYEERPTSPFLHELADEFLTVEGLTCVSSWTKPSVATLLTGLRPVDHRVAVIPDPLREPRTLPQILSENGYGTACIQSNLLLASRFKGEATGYNTGFDYYDDEIARKDEPHHGSTASDVVRRGLGWLQQYAKRKPWFLMLQFYDPHVVYEDHRAYEFEDPAYEGWVEAGQRRKVLREYQADCTLEDRRQLSAFYDEEVRAVDDALGELFAALKERDDWDDTLVVFTSDHGEELSERGYIGHTVSLHFELVDLPLMVRLPDGRRAGERLAVRLPQRDLFATLLDFCGVEAGPGRGESFAPILLGDAAAEDRPCYSEVNYQPWMESRTEKVTHMRSLILNGFKLIQDLEEDRWLLFDLREDPTESRNLIDDPDHAGRIEEMRARIAAYEWL